MTQWLATWYRVGVDSQHRAVGILVCRSIFYVPQSTLLVYLAGTSKHSFSTKKCRSPYWPSNYGLLPKIVHYPFEGLELKIPNSILSLSTKKCRSPNYSSDSWTFPKNCALAFCGYLEYVWLKMLRRLSTLHCAFSH